MNRTELGQGCWYDLDQEWLSEAEADGLMQALLAELTWEERPVVAFGQEILQPRLVGWAGELPYRYSGQTLPPRAPTPTLSALWERVQEAVGEPLNHAVVNRYRDGRDHMAMHADNEPELGQFPVIAAVSLGAPRKFMLEWKVKRKRRRTLRLRPGSLLVMGGAMQRKWRHSVPKMAEVTDERINVTFRFLHGPPGWRDPRWKPSAPPQADEGGGEQDEDQPAAGD
ncbi:MAG: alpha-ketoglutarate-dependent dioxygenase AlkB [Alphaproteobacteria bacterium]|nr:alpha-ketoglutarate-dependent dioxygenase AlkB [Alphaproteobacteria bacterium]